LRVSFDPKRYGNWTLEPYRDGLVAFSRTQDNTTQLTLFCAGPGRAELLVSYGDPVGGRDGFKNAFQTIRSFSLLTHTINRAAIKLTEELPRINLHIPLTDQQLDDLQQGP
jgi:hypothetical protein